MKGDSLVCFSDGNRRGYFHLRDGKVVVKPKYQHAWVFSEGLAAVDENGRVKFINPQGEVATIRNESIRCRDSWLRLRNLGM